MFFFITHKKSSLFCGKQKEIKAIDHFIFFCNIQQTNSITLFDGSKQQAEIMQVCLKLHQIKCVQFLLFFGVFGFVFLVSIFFVYIFFSTRRRHSCCDYGKNVNLNIVFLNKVSLNCLNKHILIHAFLFNRSVHKWRYAKYKNFRPPAPSVMEVSYNVRPPPTSKNWTLFISA